jgi:hypothetical protein
VQLVWTTADLLDKNLAVKRRLCTPECLLCGVSVSETAKGRPPCQSYCIRTWRNNVLLLRTFSQMTTLHWLYVGSVDGREENGAGSIDVFDASRPHILGCRLILHTHLGYLVLCNLVSIPCVKSTTTTAYFVKQCENIVVTPPLSSVSSLTVLLPRLLITHCSSSCAIVS